MTESSDNAEMLMGVLINKMEIMDTNLNVIKAENAALRKLINNPQALLHNMSWEDIHDMANDARGVAQ